MSEATIRAKVRVDSVEQDGGVSDKPKTYERISGMAVYSEDKQSENYSFSQATPHLSFQMTINNPAAFDKLVAGREYYLDFIPVTK